MGKQKDNIEFDDFDFGDDFSFDDLKESLYEEIDEIHRIQHLAEERSGRISDKL
mgnify:CR=1 FL=1